jgi:tRNA-2-methylthio-N6-dimethylallyladenosine synthase
MKRVYIKTYGCQMNERDSEAVAAMLRDHGYEITSSETNADVVLLNTCSVRDLAERKAVGKMDTLAYRKRRKPELVLGYMGCMAQSRGESLAEMQSAVNLVVGTQRFHRVPEYLDEIFARDGGDDAIVDVAAERGSESTIKDHVLGTNGDRQVAGFVSIMQGCEMFCTFCIVPYTRGSERSRPIGEIVEEVRRLVGEGVKEVTLLGQIVTSYGRKNIRKKNGKSAFVQLLEAVHEVKGLERIRFTAPHPKGFGDDLVRAYAELPKLCEIAHLPVQSGSNRILKAMNRGYTREWYLRIVDKLRAAQPKIAVSTDIIAGFPGETEEDFEQTASLMRDVQFDQAYIFKYSKRQDTPAADMPEQVSEKEKERRNQVLLEILNSGMARIHQKLVGQTVEILVEGRSEKAGKRMFGRTRTNKIVFFDGSERHKGELLPVRIERATHITLYGDIAVHNL